MDMYFLEELIRNFNAAINEMKEENNRLQSLVYQQSQNIEKQEEIIKKQHDLLKYYLEQKKNV